MNCPWGQKAFKGYFGEEEKEKWAEHDATELVKNWKGEPLDILIDVVCILPAWYGKTVLLNLGIPVGYSGQLLQARAASA